VRALFACRLQEVLDSGSNITADGRVVVPVDAALARVQLLRSAVPAKTPLVWCYDEVQALLGQFDGFFASLFDAAYSSDAGSTAAHSSAATAPPDAACSFAASAYGDQPAFRALPEDVAACNAELRLSCPRGWFYGLVVAVRHLMRDFGGGHLLCGSSLRLNRELLLAHSPAQGAALAMDADTRFDVPTLRSWLGCSEPSTCRASASTHPPPPAAAPPLRAKRPHVSDTSPYPRDIGQVQAPDAAQAKKTTPKLRNVPLAAT
jgi:hypothetical protein